MPTQALNPWPAELSNNRLSFRLQYIVLFMAYTWESEKRKKVLVDDHGFVRSVR